MLDLIDQAVGRGARQRQACTELGLDARTVQRWRADDVGDDRRHGPRHPPPNKLTAEQRFRRGAGAAVGEVVGDVVTAVGGARAEGPHEAGLRLAARILQDPEPRLIGEHDVARADHFEQPRPTPADLPPREGARAQRRARGAFYSGYNDVEKVSSRRRAACFAHVRRYFFESLKTAPVAQEALDMIAELYGVEHDAKGRGLSEASHLEFRKQRAGPIRRRLKKWLDVEHMKHPPKSPLGVAIRYTLGQWDELGVFLDDARVPLDNNASERALRRIALGRKNYLFVGDVAAGASLTGLYSLVATCESRGINPFDYLSDVLTRVQDHPAKAIDELLPGAWADAR